MATTTIGEMAVKYTAEVSDFVARVTDVERRTVLGRSEAEAVVAAGLSDRQIADVIDLLLSESGLTLERAIDTVKRPLFRRGKLWLAGQQPKRPAYAEQLLENFNGIRRKRSRPAPRKRARA